MLHALIPLPTALTVTIEIDASTNCTDCHNENFDPSTNCTDCHNRNLDPSTNCTKCLPGFIQTENSCTKIVETTEEVMSMETSTTDLIGEVYK